MLFESKKARQRKREREKYKKQKQKIVAFYASVTNITIHRFTWETKSFSMLIKFNWNGVAKTFAVIPFWKTKLNYRSFQFNESEEMKSMIEIFHREEKKKQRSKNVFHLNLGWKFCFQKVSLTTKLYIIIIVAQASSLINIFVSFFFYSNVCMYACCFNRKIKSWITSYT